MQSFWTPLRVGLVVAAAAAAFGFGLYFIGANIGRDRTYRVFAMFDDASGLGVRSRVQIAGDIGAVTENMRKILGGEEGENNLRTIIENLTHITQGLEGIIDRSQSRVDSILGNVQAFTSNLRTIGAGGEQDVLAILRNTRDATAEARDILKTIGGVVGSQDTGQLKESVGSVKSSMAKLDASLQNVREITEKINTGQGTIGRLVNDDKLARNLEKTTSSLNEVFGGISQLKIEIQERSEFLIGCAGFLGCSPVRPAGTAPPSALDAVANYSYNPWTKTYFSIRLIPKPDRWYGLELVDDPRGLVRRVQVQNVLLAPPGPNQFFPDRYTQITTERQLKFSAYLAKRYGPISGRFGILENTGGFGVKLHLLNDSLVLSADAFEFANPLKDHPRIKLYADYRFLDHILLTAGVDDLANPRVYDEVDRTRIISGKDYFVGAGFYFTDDDIKLLLAALPIRF